MDNNNKQQLKDLFDFLKQSQTQLDLQLKRFEKLLQEERDKQLLKEDFCKLFLILCYVHHLKHNQPFLYCMLEQQLNDKKTGSLKVRHNLDTLLEIIHTFNQK